MDDIRLGTIGSGVIVESILNAVAAIEGIRCTAVYSRSEKSGRELAGKYDVQTVYTDLEAMLEDPQVNFVYVASPNSLHFQHAQLALQHGKHVLCEKPLAPERHQVAELVQLAQDKQLLLIDAVPTAFLPNFELVRQNLEKIGPVKLVLCNYSQYSSRYDKLKHGEISNVFSPDFAGGSLQDINFYNIYFNVALFGHPDQAIYFPNLHDGQIDTSGVMILKYPGFVSTNAGAKDTWGVNSAQIEGENGYIYIRDGSNGIADVRVVTKDSDETFNEQPNPDRWFYEIQGLVHMLKTQDTQTINNRLTTTLDVIDVMETTRKNAGIYFTGETRN